MTKKKKELKLTLGAQVGILCIMVAILLIVVAAFVWVKYTNNETGTELVKYTTNNLYTNECT